MNSNSPNQTGTVRRQVRTKTNNGVRFSRFCFTIHGTPQQRNFDLDCIKTLTPKWLIVGKETCPDTGRQHLQGACVLGKQLAFSSLKNMPGFTRAHIEVMKGTPQQNLDYCTKEDPDAYQYGTLPEEGKRNDLHNAIALLQDGLTIPQLIHSEDVSIVATYCRYPKGLTTVSHVLRTNKRRVQPFVLWIHGSTGTGKTRSALELAELLGCSEDVWVSNATLQWFDGYDGQRVVVLDDYRTNHAKFSFVLRLLDRYLFQVPYKGGFVSWQPVLIIVTTPKSPRNTWNLRTEEDIAQLERRVTLCYDSDKHEDGYDLFRDALFKCFTTLLSETTNFESLSGMLNPITDAMDVSPGGDRSPVPSESGIGEGQVLSQLELYGGDGSGGDCSMGGQGRGGVDQSNSNATEEEYSEELSMSSSQEESSIEAVFQRSMGRVGTGFS